MFFGTFRLFLPILTTISGFGGDFLDFYGNVSFFRDFGQFFSKYAADYSRFLGIFECIFLDFQTFLAISPVFHGFWTTCQIFLAIFWGHFGFVSS